MGGWIGYQLIRADDLLNRVNLPGSWWAIEHVANSSYWSLSNMESWTHLTTHVTTQMHNNSVKNKKNTGEGTRRSDTCEQCLSGGPLVKDASIPGWYSESPLDGNHHPHKMGLWTLLQCESVIVVTIFRAWTWSENMETPLVCKVNPRLMAQAKLTMMMMAIMTTTSISVPQREVWVTFFSSAPLLYSRLPVSNHF